MSKFTLEDCIEHSSGPNGPLYAKEMDERKVELTELRRKAAERDTLFRDIEDARDVKKWKQQAETLPAYLKRIKELEKKLEIERKANAGLRIQARDCWKRISKLESEQMKESE